MEWQGLRYWVLDWRDLLGYPRIVHVREGGGIEINDRFRLSFIASEAHRSKEARQYQMLLHLSVCPAHQQDTDSSWARPYRQHESGLVVVEL
jgi:hypothetical protein